MNTCERRLQTVLLAVERGRIQGPQSRIRHLL